MPTYSGARIMAHYDTLGKAAFPTSMRSLYIFAKWSAFSPRLQALPLPCPDAQLHTAPGRIVYVMQLPVALLARHRPGGHDGKQAADMQLKHTYWWPH